MAHRQQREFFERVRAKFPRAFDGVKVLDCGSLDINGTLRDLFTNSDYIGVDIRAGTNVDLVSPVHLLALPDGSFDTVVSAEMLEHDEHWAASIRRMTELLKSGGLLALSAAGKGREEHGTARAPGIHGLYGTSAHYYRNLVPADVLSVFNGTMDTTFSDWRIGREKAHHDLYFYGVRR